MPSASSIRLTDVRGAQQLAVEATMRMTDLVEAMHLHISRPPWIFGNRSEERTRGITGLVYESIRTITGAVGHTVDAALALTEKLCAEEAGRQSSSPSREALLAAVNGVLGDHLAARGNPLAIPMRFRSRGQALTLERDALSGTFSEAGGRLLILVHGLCMNDALWRRNGHDHGSALARDCGYRPLYLHYNSGLHISVNGRQLADQLEALLRNWPRPVEELVIVAHSMGGLVTRSACEHAAAAGQRWPGWLRKIVFLGTPHHGAPLERKGHLLQSVVGITPYAAPLARLGMIRSAGITDLRHGNLLDEDWAGRDRFRHAQDLRRIVPLPMNTECYAVAATSGERLGDLKDRLFGDGLVTVSSALGRHADAARSLAFDEDHRALFCALSHWDLLDNAAVYDQIRTWIEKTAAP